ncbi:MAG: hypothetical protein A2X61_15905 [Ignavibacteria bacterium GWB2_35_12]|nr:MAG: hypothetical protein A2X61_15905 [Ignavibacteria bacterium GWB2_35_12]OGU87148.1 MAG: hypothetical protein A2220_08280 [Ignavibacteria bacterium RIFOXYA2_FULL_35_10]OGV24683.1 MAG: hypothetical protein A2475_14680 [Ignavibacteria bacterium RIFOXYC2_FULL_35_21]
MKQVLSLFSLFILNVIFLFLFSGCDKSLIYTPDSEWKFSVKKSNDNAINTIILKILSPKKIEWKYFVKDSNSFTDIIERSDALETTELLFISEKSISLPSSGDFKLTGLIPNPQIRFPISIGQTIKIKKSLKEEWTLKEGRKKYNGNKVTGKIEVAGKIYYNNPIVKDSCWVLNAIGESSVGSFKAKYYFNEKSGFVYFYYDFNEYKIEMELIPMK